MRVAITETLVTTLCRETRSGVVDVWDTTLRGLVLRLLPSGRASWAVRAWTAEGKRTSIKLGEYPVIRIPEARRLAIAQLAAVQKGGDPIEEKRAARRARREARQAAEAMVTVEKALEEWQWARTHTADGPWSRSYACRVESALRVHIPASIRRLPLPEVRRETWTRLLAGIAREKPGSGAFLYTALSSFLGYAEALGWIEHHPLPRRGRAHIAPHVPPRTRVLEDAEWFAVWHAAEKEPPQLRAFARLLLLTACRVSEVADMAVGEVVVDGAIWVIPASRSKNRREHVVPLGLLAQEELRRVWPTGTGDLGGQWKLLGRSPTHGLVGNAKLLRRLFATSNTSSWTWHDLRRTARTGMTYLRVPEGDAEAALNHVTGRNRLVTIYDHAGPSASGIAALRTWQNYVADVVSGQRPAGDAEAQYRAGLPEDLRYRSRPTFTPRQKAKPGRGASRPAAEPEPRDAERTLPAPRRPLREETG